MIELFVNSKPQQFTTPLSLTQLLADKNLITAKGIAVAVNDTVIPKTNWDQTQLTDRDRITIITATQGG
jgi:sulfur carrier protein